MGRADGSIHVELAWSPRAGEVQQRQLCLPQGATIADAIAHSGFEVPAQLVSAIWGRVRDASHTLCDGDRLELLRPLAVDPKEARRRRERGARQRAK